MTDARALYLDLMKKCLTNWIYGDGGALPVPVPRKRGLGIGRRSPSSLVVERLAFDARTRAEGRDWPVTAHTMIGFKRLDNLQFCVEDVLARGVPGDLIETGVWRGGATIFMRAILKAYSVTDRCVWVADSFAGLPPPDPARYPQDVGDSLHAWKELAISLEEVRANFARYDLLDAQVRFLPGWFRDTLPQAPIPQLAVIRLDGDMYESTMDALVHLYPKLTPGGYLIVDDYGAIPACRQAVEDYRAAQGITAEIQPIDWSGVYWQHG